jgi:hypothetical protein
MLDNLLKKMSNAFHWLGDRLEPKPVEAIRYLPPALIGEVITWKNKGKPTYFLKYRNGEGKTDYKYLSRDKQKAEEKREELSGWLLSEGMN